MMSFIKGLALGLLCLVTFVLGLFFNVWFLKSAENAGFTFSKELQATAKLMPDSFVSRPRFSASRFLSSKISLSADEKAAVASAFNEILARVAQEKLCRGGSYTIEPTFSYKDGVEIPKGQRVEASLSCKIKSNELERYNALLNDIDKIATKSGFITMSLPALSANFSSELLRENEEKMREELIKSALANAESYSKLTDKKCELKNLDFSRSFGGGYRTMSAKEMAVADEAAHFSNALPVVDEEERFISANATYVCK